MNPVHDVVRAFAQQLRTTGGFEGIVPDEAAAIVVVVRVLHGGSCPRCEGRRWRPVGDHHLACPRCGVVSVYAGSPLARRKLPARTLLAAIFAIFVDTMTTTARGFSRRQHLRLETAWQLLHDIRDALPCPTPQQSGHAAMVLGGCAPANARAVVLAADDDEPLRLVVVEAEVGCPPGRPRRDLPLWWARLRGWLNEVFRGVSGKHLGRYLAEYAARHGRVSRRGHAPI